MAEYLHVSIVKDRTAWFVFDDNLTFADSEDGFCNFLGIDVLSDKTVRAM